MNAPATLAALALLGVAALAGCATAPATAPATTAAPATAPAIAAAPAAESARRAVVGPDHVTLADQDALIELRQGARVHVRLESDRIAIAKRWWHITAVDGAALAPFGNPWFAAHNPYQAYAIKSGGLWIFDFDAVAPGKSTVTFDYRRDDEKVSDAERHATFTFVVR